MVAGVWWLDGSIIQRQQFSITQPHKMRARAKNQPLLFRVNLADARSVNGKRNIKKVQHAGDDDDDDVIVSITH